MNLTARLARVEHHAARRPVANGLPDVVIPNVMDFVLGAEYLAWETLYPVQATLLKTIFLQWELLTPFDERVLDRWTDGFRLLADRDGPWFGYEGSFGMPHMRERIERCRAEGRRWFREVLLVVGRRGGKGVLGALAGAYVLWHFFALDDPQRHYGIAPSRQLQALVFAGKRAQAAAMQFADLKGVINRAPCFQPFLVPRAGTSQSSLALWSRRQLRDGADRSGSEVPAFELTAVESTNLAGRGPTGFFLAFDEMAHVVNSGPTRAAAEVYEAATPALAQFGNDAFIYEASSPWTRTGKFHENYQRALAVDPETREPVNYDMFVVQADSWSIYEGWELTRDGLETYPGGPNFPPLDRPQIAWDNELERKERANPDNFRVEYRAQWAATLDAYFRPETITAMFGPWHGQHLTQQAFGDGTIRYVGHGDPALNHDAFSFVIGHLVHDEHARPNVVIDVIKLWQPQDYPDNTISHAQVRTDIEQRYLTRFPFSRVTFDQAIGQETLENLRNFVRTTTYNQNLMIERTPTTAVSKTDMYEATKIALNEGRVHAPPHGLAQLELEFLQRVGTRIQAPTSGPVQTDDIADALAHVVHHLLAEPDRTQGLATPPTGLLQGGIPISATDAATFEQLGTFRPNIHGTQRGYTGPRTSRRQAPRPGPRGRS